MTDFDSQMRANAAETEAALDMALTAEALRAVGPAPDRLVAAMRHGALSGGKRLRPFLVRQAAAVFGVAPEKTIPARVAVEMVHCYSLIHDDLPAMDDDDMRRGRPTVHRAFDEAAAILAGDALLTHAFAQLADPACHPDSGIRASLMAELAAGAGAGGMVGGQMRDLEGENGGFTDADVAQMQAMKTGALIRAAVRMGAILGQAPESALAALTSYAQAAGRAFQLADDLLDVTASAQAMGKATGKDAGRGKATLVNALGIDGARDHLAATIDTALAALEPFGHSADGLRQTARYFAERTS
jgi:farnesyl diphosphate synthase